jgi:pimeloyl-ACP methyl ester carboxylesterase
MRFRLSVATAALVAMVTINYLPTGAQEGRGGGPPLFTPHPAARDLKSVLYHWTWHMGMLRGASEAEIVTTLEYQGRGIIQVDQLPCTLATYRVSTNYQLPGQRTQIECTRPDGQPFSNIETVSGTFAWNEDIPGAEIVVLPDTGHIPTMTRADTVVAEVERWAATLATK